VEQQHTAYSPPVLACGNPAVLCSFTGGGSSHHGGREGGFQQGGSQPGQGMPMTHDNLRPFHLHSPTGACHTPVERHLLVIPPANPGKHRPVQAWPAGRLLHVAKKPPLNTPGGGPEHRTWHFAALGGPHLPPAKHCAIGGISGRSLAGHTYPLALHGVGGWVTGVLMQEGSQLTPPGSCGGKPAHMVIAWQTPLVVQPR
jgi:hypothetical protein